MQNQNNNVVWGWITLLLISAVLPLCSGCQGGDNPPQVLVPPAADFQLEINAETYLEGGAAADFKLASAIVGDEALVTISVAGAENLKALMCELTYDPQRFDPQSAAMTGELDPLGGEVIEIPELLQSEPGQVCYGQLLPWPQTRDGLDGDADLVTFRFKLQPDAALKAIATPPPGRRSQTTLSWDGDLGELSWYYYNSGDNNLNTMVELGDMTLIAMNWKASSGGGPFPETDQKCVIDYDSNGEINVADMAPLSRYFNVGVSGYNIYSSLSATDYPESAGDPNGPGAALISISYSTTSPSPSVRPFYTYTVDEPETDAYYWVRPVDGVGAEGTPSTLAGGPG